MIKVWKPVKGYEGLYEVSCDGEVRSLPKIKKGTLGGFYTTKLKFQSQHLSHNYLKVLLYRSDGRKMISVHRLVAQAFIDNPFSKPQVNHINGKKLDNRAENLEWATGSDNIQHALRTGLIKRKKLTPEQVFALSEIKKKKVINNTTGEIYNSMTEAAIALGISLSHFSVKINGKIKNDLNVSYIT